MQPIITANNGPDILLTPIKAEGIEGKISVENLPDEAALKADVNLLRAVTAAVAGGSFPLSPGTSVYRLSLSGANPALPTPGSSDVPEGDMYYCFELEVSVDSAATGTIGWPEWDWLEDPPGLSDCLGKTAYVACRLDCRQASRTITANCWRVA